MRVIPNALKLLLEEQEKWAFVPAKLVEQVYRIERLYQFDEGRPEASNKIRQQIRAILDEERLKGSTNGDAV